MDKVEGVPLPLVLEHDSFHLQLLLALTSLQKLWLNVAFSHYNSLYLTGDVQPPVCNHYVKDGKVVKGSKFDIAQLQAGIRTYAGR